MKKTIISSFLFLTSISFYSQKLTIGQMSEKVTKAYKIPSDRNIEVSYMSQLSQIKIYNGFVTTDIKPAGDVPGAVEIHSKNTTSKDENVIYTSLPIYIPSGTELFFICMENNFIRMMEY